MIINAYIDKLSEYTYLYDKKSDKDIKEAGIKYITEWDTETKKAVELRVKDYDNNKNNVIIMHPELYLPDCKTVFIFSKEDINNNEFNTAITLLNEKSDVEIRIK